MQLKTLEATKLVMFERTMMPESTQQVVNGKKEFVKTGKEVEMTTYTFRDTMGDKLVFLSKDNSYRDFEGESVDIVVDITYNEFQKRNVVKLISCQKSK